MESAKMRAFFVMAGLLYGLAMFVLTFLSLGAGEGTAFLFLMP